MGNGYDQEPTDALAQLVQILQQARAALREIQALDGSQIYNTVQELRNLIEGLIDQVNGNFTGTLTVGGLSTLAQINSLATYSRNVSGSGGFNTMQVNLLGHIGYVPSSIRYKEVVDEALATISIEQLRALRLVFFRYIASVPFAQDQQPLLLGLIAEEVHALGLTWLVVYDSEGEPEALVDFAVPFLGLLLAQKVAEELDEVREELRRKG